MKAAAIIIIVLCLAAVGGLGWLYLSSNISVSFVSCIATDAVTQPDYYNQLKKQISENSFTGTLFSPDLPETPETCQFYTFNVRMENRAFIPAEVIELQVTPMKEDLLQIGDPDSRSLASGRSAEFSATILTTKEMHNVRELTVTYYVWGLPLSAKLTTGR